MADFIQPLELMVEQFRKFPGVGRKSATRMAFGFVEMTPEQSEQFLHTLAEAKARIHPCPICGNLTEKDTCDICADPERDSTLLCVVEDVKALMAMEKVRSYRGLFHVLGGTISPMDGRGPEDLSIAPLLERLNNQHVTEVILATNPTLDGETTAMYLARLLKPLGIKTTRLASGIPVGGDLDYADEMTLLHAVDGRKEM